MGICTTCKNEKEKKILNNNLITIEKLHTINNDNSSNTKGILLNKQLSTNEGITKASSESTNLHQKIKPEIYSIEKFGVKVNMKQTMNEPLKFIFHFYNFKCKMLSENRIYIMNIIFDGKEYPLSFGSGNNPSFIFDETIGKEILFNKMSSSFMEIYLYTHKNKTKNVQFFKNMTKGEILAGTQLFSCLKIDLLTLVLAPEKHDLVLLDPKRNRVQLGRINYNISCKQVEDITIKIKSFKINLKNLNYNEIAMNLKYENISLSLLRETEYTDDFYGTPNIKDNSMTYQYIPESELMTDKTISNNNNLISKKSNQENILNDKIESNKIMMENTDDNKEIFFGDIDEYDNKPTCEKLKLHGKMSLNDILNSDITLNIFSVGLKSRTELDKIKNNNINLNNTPIAGSKNSTKRISIQTKDLNLIHKKLDLIKIYTQIGVVSLNFLKILYNNESKIERETSKFFHSLSNKKYDELNKTISNSKINGKGIEENLNDKRINENDNEDKQNNVIQKLIISAYEDVNQIYQDDIINYEGESIGNIEIYIEIIKLPLIRQTMFGVLTETGFEINSIFLYDNNNILNDLPEELLELIKLKEKFEHEISTNLQQFDYNKNILNILQNIKLTLEKTIEESCLYYGYSSDNDIYQGQEVMIDLGLILFELIDKIGLEHRKIGFEILKLILKRSEIDLGTLSVRWFKTKKKSMKINLNIINDKNNLFDYEFRDNILLERGIIEKFFKFHLEALNFSLDNLIKGKNIDKESRNFTNYYLSISYFLNPMFREEFIKQIYSNVNFKDEKYLKYIKNMKKNIMIFNEDDNLNKTQSNFILWDISFYKKLELSLSKFSINKMIGDNNINNKYIKNINAIKQQLGEIKYIMNTNDKKENISIYYSEHNWKNKIKTRGFIFYDYIVELLNYILEILNKIDENNINTKWTNIPGINKILEVINYDLIIKDAKNYPKQIYEILPLFYSEISITNHFIYSMIINTNIYDTQSIFSLLNILDYLFNKEYSISNFNKDLLKEKIDYKIIYNSFYTIINTENSLAIAKYIWFYYKNISLLSIKHVNKVITRILMPYFFTLFFHWSFQIREIFYYFLIYIINFKIKKLIKPHKQKEEIEKNQNIFDFFNIGIFRFNNNNKDNKKKKENKKDDNDNKICENKNFYFFGDLLDEKKKIIEEIIKIVDKEKYDLTYNNIIDKRKFNNIIKNIDEEYYSNIIISVEHYKKILNEFKLWDKNNKDKNIDEKNIIYPFKDIMIIKDDTIQYNN